MKKKRKMKKKYKITFFLVIVLICSIPLFFFLSKENKQKENPTETKDTPVINESAIEKKLKSLNYTKEEISFVLKEVKEENQDILLKEEKEVVLPIIKETYYIDDYLEKYITYYKENSDLTKKEIITRVNTHIDEPFYTNTIETDTTLGKFVLLNKYYHANETYQGKDLIKVDSQYNLYGSEFYLSEECYQAFLKMYEDALEAGYGFKINSAYRSYESQVKIYQGWVNKDGQTLADTYSARAGFSEHQTGYAFDVRDFPFTNDDYSKTKSFTWVSENAYKYGFIIRFPKDKEYITGYQYEPWHYRYCGEECAKYIHDTGITFEEYYEYFIKYKNPRGLI